MSSDYAANDFLHRYAEDRARGTVRSLSDYIALFPGSEEAISREYQALSRECDDPPSNAQLFGRFRVIEEIGRGGQGTVYVADDPQLGRQVALKVLSGLGALSAEDRRRFQREAEILSRLDHPGICTVFDSGIEAGVPYLVMRLIAGETLANRIHRLRDERDRGAESFMPSRVGLVIEAVRILEQVTRALQHAHALGVVHRDVKPSNIIVESDGSPVVMDFGLARDLSPSADSLTATDATFGTPAYMAPEQVAGKGSIADTRTDVYSLGVSLYEAATLERAFYAIGRENLFRQVLTSEPRDARRMNPAISGDLAAVIQKAIEKEPTRRYQTVEELGDDLRAILDGRPVRARRVSPVGRLARWGRRHPAHAILGACVFLLLVGAAVLGVWLARQRTDVALGRQTRSAIAVAELVDQGFSTLAIPAPGRAENIFKRVQDLDPGNSEALAGRCLVRLLSGDKAGLAELAHTASISYGLTPDGRRYLARLIEASDRTSDVLDDHDTAVPDAFGHFLDGFIAWTEGANGNTAAFVSAKESFLRAIFNAPAPRAIYYLYAADAACRCGDSSHALDLAQAAMERCQQSSPAWTILGRVFAAQNQNQRAMGCFDRALELVPHNALAWTSLVFVQLKTEGPQAALLLVDDAIKSMPEVISLQIYRVVLLVMLGKHNEALLLAQRLSAQSPNDPKVLATLLKAMSAAGQKEQALVAAYEARRRFPKHVFVAQTLAGILEDNGRIADADPPRAARGASRDRVGDHGPQRRAADPEVLHRPQDRGHEEGHRRRAGDRGSSGRGEEEGAGWMKP